MAIFSEKDREELNHYGRETFAGEMSVEFVFGRCLLALERKGGEEV